MLVLSCTRRLVDFADLVLEEIFADEKLDSFENWYAHLFLLQRRKCLIFTMLERFFHFL